MFGAVCIKNMCVYAVIHMFGGWSVVWTAVGISLLVVCREAAPLFLWVERTTLSGMIPLHVAASVGNTVFIQEPVGQFPIGALYYW